MKGQVIPPGSIIGVAPDAPASGQDFVDPQPNLEGPSKTWICDICKDTNWVCEDHPNKIWIGMADGKLVTCDCHASGIPCRDCERNYK